MEHQIKYNSWTGMDGTTEKVLPGSPREKELIQKLKDAGLVREGDPGYENGITIDAYRELIGLKPLDNERATK